MAEFWNAVTRPDVLSLIIFGACITMFIINKMPMVVTALIGCVAMVLLGVCDSSVVFKPFSSNTIIMIAGMMVVGRATFDTGLARLIGSKIVSLARGSERMMIVFSTLVAGVMSAFLSNIATMGLFISIATSVCAADKRFKFMNFMMPVGMATVFGGACTLVGSTPQLATQELLMNEVGKGFGFYDYSITGFIILALLVLFVAFIGYPLGKKIWAGRPEYDEMPNGAEDKAPEVNRRKLITMAIIFGILIVLFGLNDFIPIEISSTLGAIACVLTGCISHKEAFKRIDLDSLVRLAACLGIAEALNKSGGGKLIADGVLGALGTGVSPFVLFAVAVLLAQVLTQFIANSTAILMVLTFMLPICTQLSLNPFTFAMGITLGASMASMTPLANATIGMSLIGKYQFSDYAKYTWLITLVSYVVIIVLVPLLFPFTA